MRGAFHLTPSSPPHAPPSPLNGDNRAVLYVQMTTHTLPAGLCACAKLTFEGMSLLRNGCGPWLQLPSNLSRAIHPLEYSTGIL